MKIYLSYNSNKKFLSDRRRIMPAISEINGYILKGREYHKYKIKVLIFSKSNGSLNKNNISGIYNILVLKHMF